MIVGKILVVAILVVLSLQQATVLKRDNMCRACMVSTQQISSLLDDEPSLISDLNELRTRLVDSSSAEHRMAVRAVFMSIKLELERLAAEHKRIDLAELRKVCESRAFCGKKEESAEL